MIQAIVPLLALSSSPASAAAPYIEESSAGCYWDDVYDNYYWWLNAHVYDVDQDIRWAEFYILDRDENVLAYDVMWLTFTDQDYSFWYYNFYGFEGGPICPNTYRIVVNVYDWYGNYDTTSYLIREL